MHRARAAADALLRVGGVLSLLLLCLSRTLPAGAQTVFQWTDEKGVIHFSNSAPPKGVDFQRRDMPAPPPIASLPKEAPPAAPGAGGPAAKGKGPAQLVLEEPESLQEGPGAETFVGKVKNAGGAPAHQAAVRITVTDPVQGDQCLQDEIAVRPSTIAPGETGEYRGFFENPCFYGDAKVELLPLWNE